MVIIKREGTVKSEAKKEQNLAKRYGDWKQLGEDLQPLLYIGWPGLAASMPQGWREAVPCPIPEDRNKT